MRNKIEKIINYKKRGDRRFVHIIAGIEGAHSNYVRSNSGVWVSSLCYFSVLSLIPILAIAFSFGRFMGIESFLATQLYKNSPLDEESLKTLLDVAQNLLENTRSGILAGVGFIFLGWVVISMFSLIENSMNAIWRVEKSRTFFRKCTDYLTIVMLFPITLLSLSILTSPNSAIANLIPAPVFILAPYISVWIFFTVFYSIMPNCKIHFLPAVISGFFVSVVFNQSNQIFIKLQILINEYNKIYGSFSIILMFLIWLKIVWFLILVGVHLTYIVQNSQSLSNIEGISRLNFRCRYRMALAVTLVLAKNYVENGPPLTSKEISKISNIPLEMINDILKILKETEIVFESVQYDDFEKYYKLSYNYQELKVSTIYEVMENYGDIFTGDKFFPTGENLEEKIINLIDREESLS
ncbi:MAG: YhjD/YihY/BrkB family envelope integrity protein [Fusobacteriaceae bacterium]